MAVSSGCVKAALLMLGGAHSDLDDAGRWDLDSTLIVLFENRRWC